MGSLSELAGLLPGRLTDPAEAREVVADLRGWQTTTSRPDPDDPTGRVLLRWLGDTGWYRPPSPPRRVDPTIARFGPPRSPYAGQGHLFGTPEANAALYAWQVAHDWRPDVDDRTVRGTDEVARFVLHVQQLEGRDLDDAQHVPADRARILRGRAAAHFALAEEFRPAVDHTSRQWLTELRDIAQAAPWQPTQPTTRPVTLRSPA